MEAEEDMIVLVVVDDEDKKSTIQPEVKIETEVTEPEYSEVGSLQVDDLLETAERHGEYIPVKIEPTDDYEYDYLEDEVLQQVLNSQLNHDSIQDLDNSQDYDPEELPNFDNSQDSDKHRFTMLKPWQQRSLVAELRQAYPELKDDEELLVNTLEQIMRCAKPPMPPRDYYIMTGIMFECVQCGTLSESIPAASRHYQEKHGQRYLVCYACGVDFRSASNLYKHEKRCVAPDANLVLRARAAFLGRKGRSRPYLKRHPFTRKPKKDTFPCTLCSAVFMTRRNLQSHENLHRGERPYRCHACPSAYTSHSALSRHSMKHTDIQFICDHCDRSFKVKAALVSHMDTHKPMRRFACSECSRRFAQKCALQLHVHRVHRRLPPPCACQICPKRYPRMSLLKAHMKREHGMSIITRKMFFKSLPTMTELEIKQSKVVLKSEDFMTAFEYDVNAPLDVSEMYVPNVERDIEYVNVEEKDTQNYYQELEEDTEPNVDEFMQCVTESNNSLGSNVVYIQNGEVVQGVVIEQSQKNLILQVEAMVDGESLLATIKDENDANSVRTQVRSDLF